MTVEFSAQIDPDGVRISASERKLLSRRTVPVAAWSDLPERAGAAGRLVAAMLADGRARQDGDAVQLEHPVAAALPAALADAMGLPLLANRSVTLSFDGRIDSEDGRIRVRWYDSRTRQALPIRTGAFVTDGGETGRLTLALFELLEAIDAFNASAGEPIEVRIARWQPVQERLRHATGQEVQVDGSYLASLTIYQAGAFALDVQETTDGPDFLPILMSRSKIRSLEDDAPVPDEDKDSLPQDLRDETADALLPPDLQRRFAHERFMRTAASRDAYVLDRNVFLVLNPDLKVALDVVRRKRSAPQEERRAFVRNPRPVIAEALGDRADGADASLFVETEQYSERVLGLGLWQKPSLPWLSRKPGQWLPEGCAIELGGRKIELAKDDIDDLADTIEAAKAEGAERVDVAGQSYPIAEVEAAVRHGVASATSDPAPQGPGADTDSSGAEADGGRPALLLKDNLDSIDYASAAGRRIARMPKAMPAASMGPTRPKPHQEAGFAWLVDAWISGWPGVLLADDMGLGKTFQALAFLAWIRANRHADGGRQLTLRQRGPILVVAPTALLHNWIAEADQHLAPGALGERIDAFGAGLRVLKRARSAGGTADDALDVEALKQADWLLTTYETLADNHRSFARVPFAIGVFDEMQKIKDPATINTHGARAMNADFVLGLTGTPIENRIEDLWCIMDRVAPPFLGDLKTFSAEHRDENPDRLKALKVKLDQPVDGRPPVMLRRMKEGHIQGLPTKAVHHYPTRMPPAQAEAYAEAVRHARTGEPSKGAMLKAIHALRGISLHPELEQRFDAYDRQAIDDWLGRSARLSSALAILRQIEAAGEKALLFIEHRTVQATFARILAGLFGLRAEPPIINGEVPGAKRQAIVDRFQKASPGFDLLILSPKAAGIGLTITAANHVIHLSRWWNPAVEDQCNDRVYRIGQDKPVSVHLPMAIHPDFGAASFDLTLDKLLAKKRALSRHMLAPPVSGGDVDDLFGATVGP